MKKIFLLLFVIFIFFLIFNFNKEEKIEHLMPNIENYTLDDLLGKEIDLDLCME